MNYIKKILLAVPLLLLTGFYVQASPVSYSARDLENLKSRFDSQIPGLEGKIERASKMKQLKAPKGQPITTAQCLQIQKKMESNYIVSPVKFQLKSESGEWEFCKPLISADNSYVARTFASVNMVNQFGVQISYALVTPESWAFNLRDGTYYGFSAVYFDSKYRIVEMNDVSRQPLYTQFQTVALDKNGDLYVYIDTNDPLKKLRIQKNAFYISADGTLPMVRRIVRERRLDKGTGDINFVTYKRAQKDWDVVEISPSFQHLFYKYGQTITSQDKNHEELEIYTQNGKVVCMEGHILKNTPGVEYDDQYLEDPSLEKEKSNCMNNW